MVMGVHTELVASRDFHFWKCNVWLAVFLAVWRRLPKEWLHFQNWKSLMPASLMLSSILFPALYFHLLVHQMWLLLIVKLEQWDGYPFLLQVFREARRIAPSVIFIPCISSWWDVTTETFQAMFLSTLLSLPSSTPLFVLATSECPWSELPSALREVFKGVRN